MTEPTLPNAPLGWTFGTTPTISGSPVTIVKDTAATTTSLATVTNTITRDQGKLEVVKDLIPSSDLGLFNLQIDSVTKAADVGDAGTTFEQTVDTGIHTVGETAGTDTSLDDYTTSIECKNGQGTVVATGQDAGPLSVDVTKDADIVCVITNTKKGKIIVDKVTDPSGDPQLFDFNASWDAGAPPDFQLADGTEPYKSGWLPPAPTRSPRRCRRAGT